MPRHPAKFTDVLLETMYPYIPNGDDIKLLDPFAGTGKIALIKELGFKGKIYANDLESEWLSPNIHGCDFLTYEDAETLDYPSEFFNCVCTSPTYGNRMADHHNAKDGSVRMTYTPLPRKASARPKHRFHAIRTKIHRETRADLEAFAQSVEKRRGFHSQRQEFRAERKSRGCGGRAFENA